MKPVTASQLDSSAGEDGVRAGVGHVQHVLAVGHALACSDAALLLRVYDK